jgi:hypothetical protein
MQNFLFYNPAFTSLLDPYQYVDYLYYGLWRRPVYEEWNGDFCLVFSNSNVMNTSLITKFTDCHIVITPTSIDYPYTILQAYMSPINQNMPANVEVVYHTFDAE